MLIHLLICGVYVKLLEERLRMKDMGKIVLQKGEWTNSRRVHLVGTY
jgi:hypothetical protein